ncbi:MAG: hypothetical protein M1819_000016 [Sarea resinae]|nr:MAG: hypothetical protein M1819_000016 [Sarea resinae]
MGNTRTLGLDEALKIARLEYNNIKAMQAFVKERGIDCDLHPSETADIILDQQQWDAAVEAIDYMRSTMDPDEGAAQYTLHTAGEARERFFTPDAIGAVSYEAGSVHPYKLVIGILKLALEKGLNLQTNTPATCLTPVSKSTDIEQTKRWNVQTPRGTLTATKVVLATNGYSAHLYPRLQSIIVPLRGQVTAQRPGSSLPKPSLPTTYSFIYDTGYEYMIPRPPGSRYAGDIVIGGGLTKAAEDGLFEYGTVDDTCLNDVISAYLKGSNVNYFKGNWGDDDPEGRVRREWTGIMGYSADGCPFVGAVPGDEGLYISASFQGHGEFPLTANARPFRPPFY